MKMTSLDSFKSAEEYWKNPPVHTTERIASKRSIPNRGTDHADYMDFAELYADYVVEYEKAHQKRAV